MLTVDEINEVQGLVKYLGNLKLLQIADVRLFDMNNDHVATVGLCEGGEFVLKEVPA